MSNNQKENINIPTYNIQDSINNNNISDVEDDDKLKLEKNNKYYDINDNANNNTQIQTELSTMTDMIDNSSLNINEDEQLGKEIDINNKSKLESPIIKEEQNNYNSSLFYGNSINNLTPKRIGKLFAFLYIKQKPLIIIGPDCKNNILIL